jgi:hypothetical protein
MDYILHIALAAASTGAVKYGSSVASVHREISVAVVQGNHGIFRARVTRASGHEKKSQIGDHARVPGHLMPTAENE